MFARLTQTWRKLKGTWKARRDKEFDAWDKMIEPIKNRRSLYATRCFLVLDSSSAVAGNETAQIVIETLRGWFARRVSFGVLRKGILKAFEMLLLSPEMLRVDERTRVITEAVYGPNIA